MTFLYPFLFLLYTIFSFSQTDPNLVYSQNQTFLQFQYKIWQLGFDYRSTGALVFFILTTIIFLAYLKIIHQIKAGKVKAKTANFILTTSIFFLLFSNPALSHDIFNYIFNAKMVLNYHANPHVQVALDFADDPWTLYMHNIHTPAPYGYGWTALSLIPYKLGFEKLKLIIFSFKIFIGLFFLLLLYAQKKLQKVFKTKNPNYLFYAFALNPLVLIETFSNTHNDVVMMGLSLISIYSAIKFYKSKKYPLLIIPVLLFILSVSIKLASITLFGGIFLYFVTRKKLEFASSNSIAHFSPLLTSRSQQFLPWYLIWPLSFLPLIKEKWMQIILFAFTYSSLMRNLPWLYFPVHDRHISDVNFRLLEIIITFTIPIIALIVYMVQKSIFKSRKK